MKHWNVARVLWICIIIIGLVLILHAGDEGSQARRHDKKRRDKHSKGKKHRRKGRHHNHDDNLPPEVAEFDEAKMLEEFSRRRSLEQNSPRKQSRKVELQEWRTAMVEVETKRCGGILTEMTWGKFSHHSRLEDVVGKVVHVIDPITSNHHGCNHEIENTHEIPEGQPWIALIERGQCYFFNKIKLGELHNAVAVVIYNNRDTKAEVMNSVGTDIVSLMIGQHDGKRIASMADSGIDVMMRIQIGNKVNQTTFNDTLPPPRAVTAPLTCSTSAGARNSVSIFNYFFCFLLSMVFIYQRKGG